MNIRYIRRIRYSVVRFLLPFILGGLFLFLYDYIWNLDLILFPKYELPTIQILSAIGTVMAVLLALFFPYIQKAQIENETRKRLVTALIEEIILNFNSIYKAGMMEIHIDKYQYESLQKNLALFPSLWINELSFSIKQIYNLFDLYEYYWSRQNPNYTYFMYEIKFKIKIELALFTKQLDASDSNIRENLTYLLGELRGLESPMFIYPIIETFITTDRFDMSPLRFIVKNISEKDFNAILEYNYRNGKSMEHLVLEMYEKYIDSKYNFSQLKLRKLLDDRIGIGNKII